MAHDLGEKMGWKDGSPEKIALHAAIGGVMAELGGNQFTAGSISAALNETLINEIGKIKDPAIQQWVSYVIGKAAADAIGGDGQTGGSVSASGTKNNWQEEERNKEMLESLGLSEEALEAAKEMISQTGVEQNYDPNKSLEANIHDILAVGGLIPVVGPVSDGIDAGIYLSEGNYVEALLSAGAAIPFYGDGVVGLKIIKSFTNIPKGGTIIGGRKYTEHALERMAPDTLEIRAELTMKYDKMAREKGYEVGSKNYNNFMAKNINPRGITPSIVEDAIRNTPPLRGNTEGTFIHENGNVRVIINMSGDVVTVIPR